LWSGVPDMFIFMNIEMAPESIQSSDLETALFIPKKYIELNGLTENILNFSLMGLSIKF